MSEAITLLTHGAGWQFFSLLFRCPSDTSPMSIERLLPELAPGLRSEATTIGELSKDPNREDRYHRLLGSAGSISPYESDYYGYGKEGMREKGAVLGDVAAFYKAFGFEPSNETLEAPDHIALELAFLGFLKLKEVYALMSGDDEARQICSKAEYDFLQEHLLGWAPELLDRLAGQVNNEFYEEASRLLTLFLEAVAPQGETIGSKTQ
jgi:TorA maturation chaperone TorD